MAQQEFRLESDLLGELKVPVDAYYGVQTQRALNNYRISNTRMCDYPEYVISIAYVKMAAAEANAELGVLDRKIADAIVAACKEIVSGKLHDQFPVDMMQGGAGTSVNMNANEVIANRALELMGHRKGEYQFCSPNDHVNCAQSTNDAYPTAFRYTFVRMNKRLVENLTRLIEAFRAKGEEFRDIIKMGRTQLQDAVPMTSGQEFHAFATNLEEEIANLERNVVLLKEINMGGTAIGTGVNADKAYLQRIVSALSEVSGIDLIQADDLIDATQNLDPFVAVSGAIKTCAVSLSKIANDLRLMSSGPRAGFGEINLPAMQNGSSIMPGKVNPVIPEVVNQVAFNVIGNDMTITMEAEAGQLELNAFEPIIFYNLFQSIDTLGFATETFVDNCINGITANEKRCREMVENSVGIVTTLAPVIGYQRAADIAKKALSENRSVREIILEEKVLDPEETARILDPVNMTEPTFYGAHGHPST